MLLYQKSNKVSIFSHFIVLLSANSIFWRKSSTGDGARISIILRNLALEKIWKGRKGQMEQKWCTFRLFFFCVVFRFLCLSLAWKSCQKVRQNRRVEIRNRHLVIMIKNGAFSQNCKNIVVLERETNYEWSCAPNDSVLEIRWLCDLSFCASIFCSLSFCTLTFCTSTPTFFAPAIFDPAFYAPVFCAPALFVNPFLVTALAFHLLSRSFFLNFVLP